MELKYFDAHCQLQFAQFDPDRAEVIGRMQEVGMGGLVIGTDLAMSRAGLELAASHDFLWASVGIHPNSEEDFDISVFQDLAQDPKVVAIGECGLDYFRSGGTDEEKQKQKIKFEQQIELAQKLNKPLIVHCRNAHEDCFSVLQNTAITKKVPVVMHFFTGTGELAQKYLDLGCYLSFPGPITYTDMYDDSIRLAPLDKILSETDAPFAAPVPHRGKRNEPAYTVEVVKKIAAVKGLPVEDVAAHIIQNAQKVFNLPAGNAGLR